MAVEQLPVQVREFADYLNGLLARLDRNDGWCGIFWQRDPDGMRACLDGLEVPPWDVVEALLQDVAATYGSVSAAGESERARALHRASVAAYDARPGGWDALGDRLDVMLREQRYAAERQAELGRRLESAATPQEAESLRVDLAWARDDHARATARSAELRRRMAALDHRSRRPPARGARASGTPGAALRDEARPGDTADPGTAAPSGPHPSAEHAGPHPPAAPQEPAAADPAPSARQRPRRRPRGSARFAGVMDVQEAPTGAAPAAALAPGRGGPRGARFAGAADTGTVTPPAEERAAEPLDRADRRITADTVAALTRLRAQGRSGEAHALLVEAAHWPAGRYPLLAAELHRAGLGADWTTLLWEAASLPADRLVAAADALTAAGRTADGEQMLRQGVLRPASEIGEAVLGLSADGRHREVRALLDAYVRMRTPEEAARSVAADPGQLLPLLLQAARGVSDERHWDLVHALRVAGFSA
ncbi:hypothetical protein [Streptomyces sp. NPDC093261]|uniref:hypothetical protein n=1 Tax=Streptomyces sp. NPDC093261 TaxID=3366037 RepID=UPI00380D6525